jgi:hypothetical protein
MRKSLLVADRSAGQTRYSMLETIRQFAEEQLVLSGAEEDIRAAHARYFAEQEADIMALWDSPRQREAYSWFGTELANLRVAFRWAAQHGDLDVTAALATYAGILGYLIENHEPISWSEELIESARAIKHPRLATLYVLASECGLAGRIDAAVLYRNAAQDIMASGRGEVMYGFEALLGRMYLVTAHPERWAEWCRPRLARECDTRARTLLLASMVLTQTVAGMTDDAISAATNLIPLTEMTDNPHAISFALLAYGFAYRDTEPLRALDALRRGLVIAHDSGVRNNESFLAMSLGPLEAEHGDPLAALDYVT